MIGLGTIINSAGIVLGGIAGMLFGRFVNERIRDGLNTACGLSILFIGISGAMEGMLSISNGELSSEQSLVVVISMAIGTVVGEAINIELWFDRFGEWLKNKTGNAKDKNFVNGFVTASLTVCIGAMSIKPLVTAEALAGLSLVGSILIFCIGYNLIWDKKIRVANMLPAILFAAVATLV